jgi:RNA polymerase sigma-70 factor (ECF subfamily)
LLGRDAEAATGPPPSVESLYAEHFDFVWRTLRRLGVFPDLLDDATQEVFLVVHRRLPEYRPRWSPRSWLFAIARRVASDYRRSARRKGHGLPLHDSLPAPAQEGPHAGALRAEAARVVHEFLDTLDQDRREVFVLAELEQMTAREIAALLDANQSTIYSRLGSARRALMVFLRERHGAELGERDE